MNDSIRRFDRSLPMSLLRAREAVMRNFTPHLRANGVSAQQWRVLRYLNEATAGVSLSELSEQCFLLKPSLSRIIPALEERSLVKRSISKSDSRSTLVSITTGGRRLVARMAPESEARYDEITRVFGYGKLELLYELLDELVDKLDESTLENTEQGNQ